MQFYLKLWASLSLLYILYYSIALLIIVKLLKFFWVLENQNALVWSIHVAGSFWSEFRRGVSALRQKFVFNNSGITAWRVFKYGVFSSPYFPLFGLNTEIYGVNLRIISEYGKIWTRKISVFGHFSHSEFKRINYLLFSLKFAKKQKQK